MAAARPGTRPEQYPNYQVVNASISGDTTSGGKARLPALLARHAPAVVVLELGSNDALRGLALDMTESNLTAMTQQAKSAGARVLIVGMQIPPNYGRDYAERFARVFQTVAQKEQAALVPFLMEGMATDRALFQADGIHLAEYQSIERGVHGGFLSTFSVIAADRASALPDGRVR
jgi:acyl-CoA thioesterase-1